jgi:hypothetical protein
MSGSAIVAGLYESSPSSYSSGQADVPVHVDANGNMKVAVVPTLATTIGLCASVSQTRPSNTNTYGAGDVLGPTGGGTASMNFALGAVSGSCINITGVSLERDVAALISGETTYTLHLFNVTQPGAQADEATFTIASGDRTAYLGYIDIGTPNDFGDTLYVQMSDVNKQVKLAGTGIFGVLVTNGSYIAASASVLKVTINAVQL